MHFFFTCSILLYKQHHIRNKHCTFRQLTLPTAQLGYLFPLLTEDLMECRSDRCAICDLPYVVLMLYCSENSPYSKHFWPKSLDALGLVTPQNTSPPHSPHPQHCFNAVKLGKTCSAGSPSVPLYLHSLGNVVRHVEKVRAAQSACLWGCQGPRRERMHPPGSTVVHLWHRLAKNAFFHVQ